MKIINIHKRMRLGIKLYLTEYQLRCSISEWYKSRGTEREEATYNVAIAYNLEVKELKRKMENI